MTKFSRLEFEHSQVVDHPKYGKVFINAFKNMDSRDIYYTVTTGYHSTGHLIKNFGVHNIGSIEDASKKFREYEGIYKAEISREKEDLKTEEQQKEAQKAHEEYEAKLSETAKKEEAQKALSDSVLAAKYDAKILQQPKVEQNSPSVLKDVSFNDTGRAFAIGYFGTDYLNNPSDLEKISQWFENPETIPQSLQDKLPEGKLSQEQFSRMVNKNLLPFDKPGIPTGPLLSESIPGKTEAAPVKPPSQLDIIARYRQNPDLMPPALREIFPNGIPDEHYIPIVKQAEQEKNVEKLEDDIDDNLQKRREDFSTLDSTKYQPPKSDEIETREMAKQAPYKEIHDGLGPDEKLPPQDLHRIGQQKMLGENQQQAAQMGNFFAGSMPTQPIDLNIKPSPQPHEAIELWNKIKGNHDGENNYSYRSDREHNDAGHNLAASGYGRGSTAFGYINDKRKISRSMEDMDGIRAAHQLLMDVYNGVDGAINRAEKVTNAHGSANERAATLMNRNQNDAYNRQYNQADQRRSSDMEYVTKRQQLLKDKLGENATIFKMYNDERQEFKQDQKDIRNDMLKLSELAKSGQIEHFRLGNEYAQMRENMFRNRQEIAMLLRSEGRQDEAQKIEKSKSKQQFISSITSAVLGSGAIVYKAKNAKKQKNE